MKIINITLAVLFLGMHPVFAVVKVSNQSNSKLYVDVATYGAMGTKNTPVAIGDTKAISTGYDVLKKVTITRNSKGGEKISFSLKGFKNAAGLVAVDAGIMLCDKDGNKTLKSWNGDRKKVAEAFQRVYCPILY